MRRDRAECLQWCDEQAQCGRRRPCGYSMGTGRIGTDCSRFSRPLTVGVQAPAHSPAMRYGADVFGEDAGAAVAAGVGL